MTHLDTAQKLFRNMLGQFLLSSSDGYQNETWFGLPVENEFLRDAEPKTKEEFDRLKRMFNLLVEVEKEMKPGVPNESR